MTVENDTYRQPFTVERNAGHTKVQVPLESHKHGAWPRFDVVVYDNHARMEFNTYWANSGAACSHAELIALRDALTAVIDESGIGGAA